MKIYRIVNTCELFGAQYDAGGFVGLNEEQEKELKVGKFATEAPDLKAQRRDPKSTKTVKVGNKNLVLAKQSEVSGREGQPVDEGLILYPPFKNPIEKGQANGDAHATQWQNTR